MISAWKALSLHDRRDLGPGQALEAPPPPATTMRSTLSSPGSGSPRPSRFDVVTQIEPSGASTAARNRPYVLTRAAVGAPRTVPDSVIRSSHSRLPRRHAATST